MCIYQGFQKKRIAGLYSGGELLVLEDSDPTVLAGHRLYAVILKGRKYSQ